MSKDDFVSPAQEENPLVRIADSLERMEILLMKMANPPLMVRGIVGEKQVTIEY